MGASALKRGWDRAPQNPLEGKKSSLQAVMSDKYSASHRRWSSRSRIRTGKDSWHFGARNGSWEQLTGHEESTWCEKVLSWTFYFRPVCLGAEWSK